jgi:nitronate monooxygenase
MSLPRSLRDRLTVPAIAAPMFLVSGPDLVIAACQSGVIGSFPAMNCRTSEEFAAWMTEIDAATGPHTAPYAINFSLARMHGDRMENDLETCRRFKPEIIITSVGNPAPVVDKFHEWGALVLHDVTTIKHARKAAEAGVDGLILVCAGAGGHSGPVSPFALVEQVRTFFDGIIVVAGAISTGRAVRSAEVLGADLAYLGTRFIATTEAMADENYKKMLLSCQTEDVIYTNAMTGVPANFMRPSIVEAGLDPENLPEPDGPFRPNLPENLKAWKSVLSAGQGVGLIEDIPTTRDLVAGLESQYREALETP